jgi:hypothetical protein
MSTVGHALLCEAILFRTGRPATDACGRLNWRAGSLSVSCMDRFRAWLKLVWMFTGENIITIQFQHTVQKKKNRCLHYEDKSAKMLFIFRALCCYLLNPSKTHWLVLQALLFTSVINYFLIHIYVCVCVCVCIYPSWWFSRTKNMLEIGSFKQ